ncbi:MAG TPA: ribosome small subunit-dependent GTPase A [Bacteroidetes bacterium]|nr:ribosome small subunit-dependent GTPase A [Bacteroidota bacterium]
MNPVKTGVVVRSTGSWYAVKTAEGEIFHCKLKGRFKIKGIRTTNPLAVGDRVDFRLTEESGVGVIVHIDDRKNYIIRKATNLSKASHIIAANLDQAVLIVSLVKPRTSSGFIDRFLVTAEAYHIPAIVVFNKRDIYDTETLQQLNEWVGVYSRAGYRCLVTSAKTGLHLDELKRLLQNKVSLLSGHSGVGKSALINRLDPLLNLKEGEISKAHQKGKHTTTFAEMFPLAFGGEIIDTPGIKEFGLVGFEKTELGQRFPEIRKRMENCRFSDCLHVNEPGCAVREAVENGAIAAFRYQNYLNMLQDISAAGTS